MKRPLIALGLSLAIATLALGASDYPNKPIRILVPYGPGGATDIATRIISDNLRERLGQPIVIENKPGGSGVVALQEVVRAKPDGYTLVVGNITTNLLNQLVGEPPMPFDPMKALTPVVRLVDIPGVFITTKVDFPPNSLKEFVEYAKARPGQLNHTIAGHLAYSHIDLLMLQKRTGIKMVSVPQRAGAGGGQIDMINGAIHVALTNAATVLPLVQAGKIKALAVTSEQRLPAYPNVPTFKEAGFGGIGTNAWQAVFAPAATPKDVLDAISIAFIEALKSEKVLKQLQDLQYTPIPTASPEEARAWLAKDMEHWKPIVEEAKGIVKEINQ